MARITASIDVVQGGFITVMLDATMSRAVFAHLAESVVALSSYEVTTRYHAVTRSEKVRYLLAAGFVRRPLRPSYKSELLDEDGNMLATAQSVIIVRANLKLPRHPWLLQM